MKIQWYKRLICHLFIFILFLSGMQVNIDNSHSYFACESQATTKELKYTNAQTFISSDYCTTELIQPRNQQYIRNNSTKTSAIRRTNNLLFKTYDLENNLKLFYFEEQYISKAPSSRLSQMIIINYIHRQDGAK